MKKVALATFSNFHNLPPELLQTQLQQRGVDVRHVVWDSKEVDWGEFDAIVIRSCWDYHEKADEFREWVGLLEGKQAPLWNPAGIVKWNMDKVYLKELQEEGVNVVPTVWFEKGVAVDINAVLEEQGWGSAVVKPTISASAFQTWAASIESRESNAVLHRDMSHNSGIMVQKFMEEVRTQGEWSFVFIGQEFSHAMLKRPKAGDFRVQSEYGGSPHKETPAGSLTEQARQIANLVGDSCLYARVDGLDVDGRFFLMELELIEPYLFLGENEYAPGRFADAILSTMN